MKNDPRIVEVRVADRAAGYREAGLLQLINGKFRLWFIAADGSSTERLYDDKRAALKRMREVVGEWLNQAGGSVWRAIETENPGEFNCYCGDIYPDDDKDGIVVCDKCGDRQCINCTMGDGACQQCGNINAE
ncbi:MAG: hypothetical protein ACR2PR_09225 [Pseudohongiellaceae bacterium]